MTARLLVHLPPAPLALTLRDDQTLGRDSSADVVIDHPTVSRRHARIVHTPSGWILTELGSRNGTKVNGKRLLGLTRLKPGDRIRLGRVTIDFTDAQAAPDAEDAPAATGKLVRCSCGSLQFVPRSAKDVRRNCPECGATIDEALAPPPPPRIAHEDAPVCSICRHAIHGIGTTCPACDATSHADCWHANGGCATFGCEHAARSSQDAEVTR